MFDEESGMKYNIFDGTPFYFDEPVERYDLPKRMKKRTSQNTSNQCQEGTCASHALSKIMCNFIRVVLTPDLSSLNDFEHFEKFEDCDDLYNITKCPNILECLQRAQQMGCSSENIFYALLYRIFYRILTSSEINPPNFQIINSVIEYCKTMTPTSFFNFWHSPTENMTTKSFKETAEELTLKLEDVESLKSTREDLSSLELNLKKVLIQGVFVDEYHQMLDLVYISLLNLKIFIESDELQILTFTRSKMRQHLFVSKMKKILDLNLYLYLSVKDMAEGFGHALTIVGYDESRDVIFIKNSWGRGRNYYKSLVTQDSSGLGVMSLRTFQDPLDPLIMSVHAIIPKEYTEFKSGTRKLKGGFTKQL